jgi:hypothetical protein
MRQQWLCTFVCAVAAHACTDPEPPPPPIAVIETAGPHEPPIGGVEDPDPPPAPDVPDEEITTGVDPGVTTGIDPGPEDPRTPPGVTTIDPGVTTVDTVGPQPPGPPTGTEGPCFSVCDCPPQLSCLEGFCQATLGIRWCCTEAACPSGSQCETPDGRIGLCPP